MQKATAEHKKRLAVIQEEETKAGNLDTAVAARGEIKRIDTGLAVSAKVETAEDLKKVLLNSEWELDEAALKFRAASLTGIRGASTAPVTGLVGTIRWEAIDRRTVLLIRKEAQAKERIAVFRFSEWLDRFEGYDFDGKAIEGKTRVIDKK
jgi:hypothetical protein